MYLKALEIQGFKSFPEKTRLTFEKSVSAIVGPNGSGKSNLSDAIQWVMGEQSTKALRSGKMEDVIFGGTQKRSPVGFAEVSLILDNADRAINYDADEVEITRRYYRSGDSEYYINRHNVRLRDISELLMDTGLGRDGYSIIGQGRIDEILSTKSTDRRDVFEEAAGISRFRYRKEEAERKLTRAEENLLRVNDKIAELELQVGPLKEQSETAKKYLLLRDELRGLEIALWLAELDSLKVKKEKLETDAIAASGDLERARIKLQEFYAQGEALAEKTALKDREAESVRGQISEKEALRSKLESEISAMRAEIKNNLENLERIKGEIKEQEGRDSGLVSQIEERNLRLNAIDGEEEELKKEAAVLEESARKMDAEEGERSSKIAVLREAEARMNIELSALKAEITSLSESLQASDDQSAGILLNIQSVAERLEEAQRAKSQHKKRLEEAQEEAGSLLNVVKGYGLRVEGKRKKTQELQDKKTHMAMELSNLRSRKNMLSEMEREYASYSKAVKTVMREAERGILKGVHGPAGELIKVSGEYAVAVETAMGAAMQNIIVSSEENGKAAINLLKRTESGRVTFLPMSVIKGTRLSEKGLEGEEGFIGVAFDLVKFDDKYRDIYLNLLGRIAVAEDLDAAIRISRKYSHRFRIVTLDGQVMNAGGSMTGGSASKNTGILSRANELESLIKREAEMAEKEREIQKAFDEAKRDLDASEYELEVSKGELRRAEDAAVKLEAESSQHDVLVASLEESAASLKADVKAAEERAGQYSLRIKEARERSEALSLELMDTAKRIEDETGGAEILSERRRNTLEKQALLRARTASLNAEKETIVQAVGQLVSLRSDLLGGKERQEETVRRIHGENDDLTKAMAESERLAASFTEETQRYKKRLAAIAQEKLDIEADRVKRDRETQSLNEELIGLERESSRIEQRREAAEMEEKQLIDKLWDNYELSRTAAMEQRREIENAAAARNRTHAIKREMSALGTPNLGAIEEFERVNTRYQYLSGERDDIEKSKAEITEIINDITEKMTEIFAVEFQKISESFTVTFAELFGGGNAYLELEDPEDILGCGIEIRVQPPGKTVKALSLLSGGEKAFVAIALYFAIIKVRPTPFVIMDEIEAALDEENVRKFAEYMHNLSDKTQFLTITHRRGTMESADVLYGVTMQEQGISKVLKLDLAEAEKTIKKK